MEGKRQGLQEDSTKKPAEPRSLESRSAPSYHGAVVTQAGPIACAFTLDDAADVNLVSQTLVLRIQSQPIPEARLPYTKSIFGNSSHCYGAHELRIRLADSDNTERETTGIFYAMEFPGDPVLLGRPWRFQQGVQKDDSTDRWRYGSATDMIRLCSAEELRTEVRVYAVVCAGDTVHEVTVPRPAQSVPTELKDFADVFGPAEHTALPRGEGAIHAIELEEGKQPPYQPLYNLSATELQLLRDYLDSAMEKGWIRRSESAAGAPILFVPKKDGTMRLCVDYRGLNAITIKNRHPLPLISETLDRLGGARWFSKIDLKDAYHRIPIRKGDEWKTAFRTRYGHFEYLVMPFGLTNAPATFQAYIIRALAGFLDEFCVVYLDDILIFSTKREEHTHHLRRVLERLRKYRLVGNLKKCEFYTQKVEFLGFIVSTEGVAMDQSRVDAIAKWPLPASYHDIQVFLGFANFYRRFIEGYSRVAHPLTSCLKGSKNGKKQGPFELSEAAEQAFRNLVDAFIKAPILSHYQPQARLRVESDASDFAIAAILSQLVEAQGTNAWHPIAFWSRKLLPAEQNYETHDKELLAIVAAFKHWRHYLEGATHTVQVLTDHNNLKGFMTMKQLNGRQARWAMQLSSYDFTIEHRSGKSNPADAPSRRPDYAVGEKEVDLLLPTLQSKLKALRDSEDPLVRRVAIVSTAMGPERRGRCDNWQADSGETQPSTHEEMNTKSARSAGMTPTVPTSVVVAAIAAEDAMGPPTQSMEELIRTLQPVDEEYKEALKNRQEGQEARKSRWTWKKDVLYKGQALYVPNDSAVKTQVLRMHHDDPLAGHFGRDKTVALISRKYYWPTLYNDVSEYIDTCDICQRSKARRHRPYGEMAALPQPQGPWEQLTMDFITDLPPSRRGNDIYDAVLVVVDRYTKMSLYLPCTKRCTSADLATLILDQVIARFGVPKGIVTDRGSVFTSEYWSELCFEAKVKRRLSTAFHPQTDGQTERQNQTLEQYLRCYCCDKQDQWAAWLPLAEFAYNNSVHPTLRMSPFFALYGYNPALVADGEDAAQGEGGQTVPAARERIQNLRKERTLLTEHWRKASATQARGYNRTHKPRTFNIGDQVLLSAKNLRIKQPSRKLSSRYIGPLKVLDAVGTQAYRLALPSSYRVHNVFHVSLLEPYHPRDAKAADAIMPLPELVEGEEEYEVERILEHRNKKGQRYFFVKWANWPEEYNQWVPKTDMEHAPELIQEYEAQAARKKHAESKKRGEGSI